nr:hypothetical protein [Tanacetum cinerariifolium]
MATKGNLGKVVTTCERSGVYPLRRRFESCILPKWMSLRSHATFQCQPMDQNIDSFGFDQIQTPQYPEMSKEVFQAKGNLMKSIQTFLEKFNFISFGEMPKVLLQACEKFFAIQHAQPEDTNELFQKLLEDLQIINEELAEYINSPS